MLYVQVHSRKLLLTLLLVIRRWSFDFPVLTCATALTEAGIRMAIGARPGKAMLVTDEENLVTLPITAEKAKAFAEYAAAKIPTSNTNRGSAEYRTHLVKVLAERTIMELGGKA